jgi:flagellar biosynthesis protein FlhG
MGTHLGDTLPPPPPHVSDALARFRSRRILAIGGGRGGVGKTLLAVNLGVYFAQLGREVVLCDADPSGSSMHTVLGVDRAPLVVDVDLEERQLEPVATSVPGLRMLPSTYDPLTGSATRPSRGAHLIKMLQRTAADYVIVNLGSSMAPATLDLFLESDIGVCVTAPEPLAVETTYRFVRALYLRVLRKALMKERYRLRTVEKVAASLSPLPSPLELVRALRRVDDGVAMIAAQALARVVVRLVVGQTRLRSDLDLGPSMATVSERFLGIPLDNLGHVEQDDAVWLTVRRRQPLLIDSPTSRSARNVERVARRILAILAAREQRSSDYFQKTANFYLNPPPRTLYDVLCIARGAADDEIRRAYKRQREIFQTGSLPIISVMGQAELEEQRSRIEEAHDTLLDAQRRKAYDLSVFPDDVPESIPSVRNRSPAEQAELDLLVSELAREIDPDTEFTGALLRRVRLAQAVSLEEIAHRTKISSSHLLAIEDEDPRDLPAFVYVQGFVQELAKYLKLDPHQVARTYMRRYREIAEAHQA